jgi:5-methylcytosine-specific restriction enzyme A
MFKVTASYTRLDVLNGLGLPDPGGGAWYTGLVRHHRDHYIFCGVGVSGRTGHDYQNHFDGPDLVWYGRTGSTKNHPSIVSLLSGGNVHVFFRDDNRAEFTYAGLARPVSVKEVVPVEIKWSFREDSGPHPEFLPDEL